CLAEQVFRRRNPKGAAVGAIRLRVEASCKPIREQAHFQDFVTVRARRCYRGRADKFFLRVRESHVLPPMSRTVPLLASESHIHWRAIFRRPVSTEPAAHLARE